MSHSFSRTSGQMAYDKDTYWRKFWRQEVGGKTAADGKTRGRFSLALLVIYALYTCIIVQIYAKSGRKGRQCVLRAISSEHT
jgi:hypothetical protein